MTTEIESWLRSVLGDIGTNDDSKFSGLGIVFYTERATLPVHPLVSAVCEPPLPINALNDARELISSISRRDSIFHDGFHLVDAKTLSITDVSQFLSPPIAPQLLSANQVRGARHMAARLASLLPAVSLVAVCTQVSQVTIYERGKERTLALGFT